MGIANRSWLVALISALLFLSAADATAITFDPVTLYASQAESAALEREFKAFKDQIRKVNAEYEKRGGCRPSDLECLASIKDEPESPPAPDEPWVVFDCGFSPGIDPALEGSPMPASTLGLITAAKVSLAVYDTFSDSGYPESLWKEPLAEYERAALLNVLRARYLENNDSEGVYFSVADYPYEIVTDAQVYRIKVNPKLHMVEPAEGCGAGEFQTRIRADGAISLSIISEFLFDVCKVEQPTEKAEGCKYWTEVPLDEPIGVSGSYRYRVKWAEGKVTDGAIDFDRLGDATQDEEGIPVFKIKH